MQHNAVETFSHCNNTIVMKWVSCTPYNIFYTRFFICSITCTIVEQFFLSYRKTDNMESALLINSVDSTAVLTISRILDIISREFFVLKFYTHLMAALYFRFSSVLIDHHSASAFCKLTYYGCLIEVEACSNFPVVTGSFHLCS